MVDILLNPRVYETLKALIVVLALVGAGLNAAGKWYGFLFWMVTNFYWCVYNFMAGEYE